MSSIWFDGGRVFYDRETMMVLSEKYYIIKMWFAEETLVDISFLYLGEQGWKVKEERERERSISCDLFGVLWIYNE